MPRPVSTLLLVSVLTLATAGQTFAAGQTAKTSLSSTAHKRTDAVTAPKEDRQLSFTVPGKVRTVHVKEGQVVSKGQEMITLESKPQEIAIHQAELGLKEAAIRIKAADAQVGLAEVEFKRHQEMMEKDAGSKIELERAEVTLELRKAELLIAQAQVPSINLDLDLGKAMLDQYMLRAPIDGRIERVEVAEGETVQQLRPVLLLVVTDPLKIEAAVDIEQAMKLKPGDEVWVYSQLSGFKDAMEGQITFTATVADPASETLRVTVEVPNPAAMKAGTAVAVSFDGQDRVAAVEPDGQ